MLAVRDGTYDKLCGCIPKCVHWKIKSFGVARTKSICATLNNSFTADGRKSLSNSVKMEVMPLDYRSRTV